MNKSYDKIRHFLLWLSCGLWLLAGCSGVNARPPGDTPNDARQVPFFKEPLPLVVPDHTMLYVRLQQSLSSATAEAGERFEAVLDEPLVVGNQTIAAGGTPVTGSVVAVRR